MRVLGQLIKSLRIYFLEEAESEEKARKGLDQQIYRVLGKRKGEHTLNVECTH